MTAANTGEAQKRAEEKIEAAIREGSATLELQGGETDETKLTVLPESLGSLTRLTELDLTNNRLASLPDWLCAFTQLKKIILRSNRLTSLPTWFSQLTQLSDLDVAYNKLTTVPLSLRRMTQLRHLDLRSNELQTLPAWIAELDQLAFLGLGSNQLTRVPDSLGRLERLQSLSIYFNLLSALPSSVGQLQQLRYVSVYSNHLKTLPESFKQLKKLQTLDIGSNQFTVLPSWIGELVELEILNLSNNQLRALPDILGKLVALKELYLHGNPQLELPAGILGPYWVDNIGEGKGLNDPRPILAFYFARQKQNAKPLNEVKLLLVGHGRVGKTSISKALREVAHDEKEPETPGIERNNLALSFRASEITAHIWDFGGQEFLHQTHQFFFSERSIYLVVLSGRQGRPMQEAEYWLRLIRTYGTDSPVVIVLNQIKAHPFTIDEIFLRENYPEVKAVVKTDCDPRFGIEPLRKTLGRLANGMPSVKERIDPAWARVRARLEKMKESFVAFPAYRQICTEEGVETTEDQETLATILDCLGIALNYREDPRLRDTSSKASMVGGWYLRDTALVT